LTGTELRRLRLRLGLTQREMAKRLGLATFSIQRYETGGRRINRVLAMAVRCLALHGGTGS